MIASGVNMKNKPTCEKCKQTFESFRTLDGHNNRKIPCDRVLSCVKCNREFKRLEHLVRHQNRKTTCSPIKGDPTKRAAPNTCIYCRKQLSTNSSLKRHHRVCVVKNGRMDILFDEVKRLKNINAEVKQLKDKIKLLEGNQVINITNNITNVQNNHINNTLNINFIHFEEDGGDKIREILGNDGVKLIEQKFVPELPMIEQLTNRVVNLIGLVFRNPEHKDLQGIYLVDPSKEKDNAYFHDGGQWQLTDWIPLRRRMLNKLYMEILDRKIKKKDTENITRTISGLSMDGDKQLSIEENDIIRKEIGDLMMFNTIKD